MKKCQSRREIETVSINLSAKQLADKGIITTIKETLELTKCKLEWIEFEVTEGVENEAQQRFLLEHGCKLSQGYLYWPPMPKEQFENQLHPSLSG